MMIKVYFKKNDGTLGVFEASDFNNHVDAINAVRKELGPKYRKPILAVIK